MTTPLTLTPGRRPDGTAMLTVVGEIDMSNTESLAAALASAPGPLVLDLTDCEYLDSAGLSILFPHADRLELIAGPLLAPVLAISGLTGLTTRH
ncbi:STAS domain-containing protein [Streptomyces sp. SID9727]|uniref:STAS domain-containing protein n=1 Tax=Streptomyces sp. SID9727 TaxID=2706114 RepID=UPI0013CA9450|nr:STAS domain-containing protein [Streptomyces sp. SID9727]NEC65314.1 STAS domain-containing protein [Streptomyces sp. SID9727]